MSLVAVAIFTHKAVPDCLERISLLQCARILGRHPLYLVYPRGMAVDAYLELAPLLKLKPLPPSSFKNITAYNRMKMRPWFYQHFIEYEYLLTYELDSFVFRDDLVHWCNQGWDYIGAPWFKGSPGIYDVTEESPYTGVGNSGFSLRKVESVLKVARSFRHILPLSEIRRQKSDRSYSFVRRNISMLSNCLTRNRFHWAFNGYKGNEDFLWGLCADRQFGWWRTADHASARAFSFEANAPMLHREHGQLPFGCHKWNEIHREFWRPHIEAYGYELPDAY